MLITHLLSKIKAWEMKTHVCIAKLQPYLDITPNLEQ